MSHQTRSSFGYLLRLARNFDQFSFQVYFYSEKNHLVCIDEVMNTNNQAAFLPTIGSRWKIYWSKEDKWFPGSVIKIDLGPNGIPVYHLAYDDNTEGSEQFNPRYWKAIEEVPLKRPGLPMESNSKKKAKIDREPEVPAKKLQPASNSKY